MPGFLVCAGIEIEVPIKKLRQLPLFRHRPKLLRGANPRYKVQSDELDCVRFIARLINGEDMNLKDQKDMNEYMFWNLISEFECVGILKCGNEQFEVPGSSLGSLQLYIDHPWYIFHPYEITSTRNASVCAAFVRCVCDPFAEVDVDLREFHDLCEEIVVNMAFPTDIGNVIEVPIRKLKELKMFTVHPGSWRETFARLRMK